VSVVIAYLGRRIPVGSDRHTWGTGDRYVLGRASLNQSVMAKSVKSNRSGLPFVSTISTP
jgi:hypothetical protein